MEALGGREQDDLGEVMDAPGVGREVFGRRWMPQVRAGRS